MSDTGHQEELCIAISTYWDSDDCADVRTKIAGGLHIGQAPPNVIDGNNLYCVYRYGQGSVTKTSSTDLEQPTIDFLIHAPGEYQYRDTIRAVDAITHAWDDVVLDMANDQQGNSRAMVSMTRMSSTAPLPEPERGWFAVAIYEVITGHKRADKER